MTAGRPRHHRLTMVMERPPRPG